MVWKSVRLIEAAELNPNLPQQLTSDEEVSFVPMAAVSAETAAVEKEEIRTYAEVAKGFTPFIDGDVLVAKITPCFENGKIVQANLSRSIGFGSTEFHVVRPQATKLDARYILHFLRQIRVRKAGERRMTGSAGQRRVPENFLSNLEIPFPPLKEQRRIANILDRTDALRAKRRGALAQLNSLTQSIFLDLFGDPATNPKGWPKFAMERLFSASPIFGTMVPPTIEGGTWLSLRVANIQDWQLDLTDQKFVELPASAVDRHSVQNGDVLLARAIASQEHLGKAVVVYPNGRRWAFDSHLMRLRFNTERAEPEFIRSLLMTPGGRQLFLRVTRRSVVQFNINTKEIAGLQIPIPPLHLQREFVRRVLAVKKLKTAQSASLDQLDSLFASLQYRAFRGEL